MADVITRLKVESSEYDSKIRRAVQGLQQMESACRRTAGTLAVLEKDEQEYVRSLGQMETVSRTARGRLNELTAAFTDLRAQYNRLTQEEKQGDFGRALNSSLEQLKVRINETKTELQGIQREMGGSKFGQFGSVIDGIGQKMGITANITELLTSRTALMATGIGAATTAVMAATRAWTEYNAEIARQQQITTVTTGLTGGDADNMTSAARALAKTYDVDFREAINAANTLMTQFGTSGDEAMQLLRQGMQGMIAGDGPKMLSMIQQFAPAFQSAGVSASELVAIIHNTEGGIFTEQNMQAIIMGISRLRNMSNSTAEALRGIGINADDMKSRLESGTMSAFGALQTVGQAIENQKTKTLEVGVVMSDVFGRQGKTAGDNLGKAIATLNTNLEDTKRQTGDVGQAYNELYEANVRLEKALRQTFGYNGWEEMTTGIKTDLVSAMASVLETAEKINTAFENNLGFSYFDGVVKAAEVALGPLGKVLEVLRDINSEQGNGAEAHDPYEDVKKAQRWIDSGKDYDERLRRYNANIAHLRQNLNRIGKEYSVKIADNKESFRIDDPETQKRQRTAIMRRMQMLKAPVETAPDTETINVDTKVAQQNVDTLKKKLKELELQRRDAVKAGDQGKVDDLSKQISQTKTNLGYLSPSAVKTGSSGMNTAEQAAKRVADAEHARAQAVELATLEVKNGTATNAQAKQKEYSAMESLWKAYGDAYNKTKDPKYKEAQDNLANKLHDLGQQVTTSKDAQKLLEEQARKNAAAGKRLEKSSDALYQAQNSNDLKAFYKARDQYKAAGGDNDIHAQAAQVKSVTATVTIEADTTDALKKLQEVEGVTFDPKTTTVTATTEEALKKFQEVNGVKLDPKTVKVEYQDGGFTATTANIDAFIQNLKQRISESEVGTDIYNNLTAQLADTQALSNLVKVALKNGIDPEQIGLNPQEFWSKIFGENPGDYINDNTWQSIIEKLNAYLKDEGIDLSFGMKPETGEMESKKDKKGNPYLAKDENGKQNAKVSELLGGIAGGMQNVVSGLEQLGVEIPADLKNVLGGMQTISSILTGIAATVLAIKALSTASLFKVFSHGGVVHAANGWAGAVHAAGGFSGIVPGHSYSGDNVHAMLNSGETVLNVGQSRNVAEALVRAMQLADTITQMPTVISRSQQAGLAGQLAGNGLGNLHLSTTIYGEDLVLAIDNVGNRRGDGEYVTAKFR